MIVRQFISWIKTAPAGERPEATRSLARAWLISISPQTIAPPPKARC